MYIESEEQDIRKDWRSNKLRILSWMQVGMMALLLLFGFAKVYAMMPIRDPAQNWFPAFWICHNCGYENYEGIDHCGLCGKERNQK